MEPDSTTFEIKNQSHLPFNTNIRNLKLYNDFTETNGTASAESQLVEKLQLYGLIPRSLSCPTNKSDCKLSVKTARVIDRVQWSCKGCGKRSPIRTGSFFHRLPCSILQTLQIILAWSEDADLQVAAEHFGVKQKVARQIFDKLDDLVIKEHKKCLLGGENTVILTELYPDCVNRLSPDTTDQPHLHRILMLADTKLIPTDYRLHVLRDDAKKGFNLDDQALTAEVRQIISETVESNSMVVNGSSLPNVEGASSMQQLLNYCDGDMKHFLTTKIWRQAVTLCAASRDFCAGSSNVGACAGAAQRYLHVALYRLRHRHALYDHVLNLVAKQFNGGDTQSE
ncbi:uncharacterized protein LOC114248866 [Bombyx mandarina]|uniref:Uncharacterized protein LOC114248866 n=1 Tax=Bombyx mandarina TaxID=7092 RepID=A0A6J2K740_BOMMA|nr:uncharacterized protein LOC114248866 [Bombyx mandarina]